MLSAILSMPSGHALGGEPTLYLTGDRGTPTPAPLAKIHLLYSDVTAFDSERTSEAGSRPSLCHDWPMNAQAGHKAR